MEIYKNLSLEDLPNEEWRDVVGYERLYQVSNLGRVKSLDRTIPFSKCTKKVKGKVLSQHTNFGYCLVSLGRKGQGTRVHRLVADAFIPNPSKLPIINHINEVKHDNRVENLEWCDYSYNLNYGSRNGWQRRLNGIAVCQYTKDGVLVAKYSSIAEASEQCKTASRTNIFHCCKKRKPSAGGYVWRYEGDNNGVKYINRKLTAVIQYDKFGNFIAKYNTIKEAATRTGIRATAISNCLAGLSQTSGGFYWEEDK